MTLVDFFSQTVALHGMKDSCVRIKDLLGILFSLECLYDVQDFYLDLVEDNRRITPRDYLEIALRPVQGSGRDIAAKNEVSYCYGFLALGNILGFCLNL